MARIHPDDRDRVMTTCREAVARGLDHELEYRALTADGREVRLRDIVHVRHGPSGRAIQLRGVTVDLTEHQRAAEALRQTEEQLRQAQKMDAVGKLAGGIAHDFNNLLMVIRGDSDLILRRLSPEDPLRVHAERTREAADQAATLTRKLLAFSRKQVLAPAVLDVNRIVDGLHTMLDRLLGETIELVTVTAPNLGSVTADPGQVEQVLLNLAVNARDAMPDGGRLTIQTADRAVDEDEAARTGVEPGPYVVLEVKDTGVGMDADMKAHLFEPFFTTKDARHRARALHGVRHREPERRAYPGRQRAGQGHDVPRLPPSRRSGIAVGRCGHRPRDGGDRDRRAPASIAGRDHPPRRGRASACAPSCGRSSRCRATR